LKRLLYNPSYANFDHRFYFQSKTFSCRLLCKSQPGNQPLQYNILAEPLLAHPIQSQKILKIFSELWDSLH
jgi:hypothetical protein